jgi:uncharacterized protein
MIEEPLSLYHKNLLYESLRAIGTAVSEYSFANLYLFRKKHEYSVLAGKELFIAGKTYDGVRYIMPTKEVGRIDKALLDEAVEQYGMLFPVIEEWLPLFNTAEYAIDYDEAESDYLHAIEKLATYKGRRFHDKKNLLNQFRSRYAHRAMPLTTDRLDDARAVLALWQEQSGSPADQTDYDACSKALTLYDELTLCGAIYYVGEKPAGFILGEELNSATFAIHFAKGDRTYKGIYQFMYHQFATIMPAKYAAFNFEQDLGLESLKRAKASYQPERMLRKYRVTRRTKT